ncbi:MAG: hypothetical protein R3F55_01390 [Alphaproteobacteria bacterium]
MSGGPEWIEQAGGRNPVAERQRRIALVNRLLADSGVKLSAQGRVYVVRSATGRSLFVPDLTHVWAAADKIGRGRVDPLAVTDGEDDGGDAHADR